MALNKIMSPISGRHDVRSATPSTFPTTDSDITIHFPHESDVKTSAFFDVFTRVESRFNHFRSVIYDPSARVVAISAVHREIDAAEQLFCTLRNALAPISLLPAEVLVRVFHFLALEELPCSGGKPDLGWIRVTHVCRFWRQVALGDSSLWARIEGLSTYTMMISEMLARARNAPLDINIDLDKYPSPEVLRMFSAHLSHTRKLRLHDLSALHSDSVRGIYSQEAPALEHFELGVSIDSLITVRELDGTTLFKGQAPRLRTLILSQVLIQWSLIPRGQLTQLSICLFSEVFIADQPSYGDLNQLIDLLANSPGLEILVLGCCLPSQLTLFPHGQTINLPRLSLLCLGGSSSRMTNLFEMLKLPSSTKLHFHCFSENPSAYNDHLLLPDLSAHFQNPTPVEFKNLSVTLTSSSLKVTASTSVPTSRFCQPHDFESDVGDGDDEFVLSFDELLDLGHCADLLARACKMLPISNLEFLSISAPNIFDSVNWVELFKRCTKVTAVRAIGRGTSSLVRALATPKLTDRKWTKTRRDNTPVRPARSAAAYAYAPIFPKLMALSLKRLDLAEKELSSGILFDVIEKGLRQRRSAYKAPLKTLEIDNCAISARRAKALEKLVQGFHWDGGEDIRDEFEGFDDGDPDFVGPVLPWELEGLPSSTTQGAFDWAAEDSDEVPQPTSWDSWE